MIAEKLLVTENEADDDTQNTGLQPSGKHSVATETSDDLIEPVRDNIVVSVHCRLINVINKTNYLLVTINDIPLVCLGLCAASWKV